MGEGKKALWMFAGIIICIALIGLGVWLFGLGSEGVKSAGPKMTDLQTRISDSQFSEFDNRTVAGTTAINAIRMYASSSFSVTIKTKANTSGQTYQSSGGYIITDISNANYIEPTANFKSELNKSANGTVNGITLTQM